MYENVISESACVKKKPQNDNRKILRNKNGKLMSNNILLILAK